MNLRFVRPAAQALLEDSRVGQGVFRLAGLDPAKVEEAIKARSCSCLAPCVRCQMLFVAHYGPCRRDWHTRPCTGLGQLSLLAQPARQHVQCPCQYGCMRLHPDCSVDVGPVAGVRSPGRMRLRAKSWLSDVKLPILS